jgi:hypothetical protein
VYFAGFITLLVLVMMLSTLLITIDSDEAESNFKSPLFVQAVLIVSLFFFNIVLICYLGSLVNLELIAHR